MVFTITEGILGVMVTLQLAGLALAVAVERRLTRLETDISWLKRRRSTDNETDHAPL